MHEIIKKVLRKFKYIYIYFQLKLYIKRENITSYYREKNKILKKDIT